MVKTCCEAVFGQEMQIAIHNLLSRALVVLGWLRSQKAIQGSVPLPWLKRSGIRCLTLRFIVFTRVKLLFPAKIADL